MQTIGRPHTHGKELNFTEYPNMSHMSKLQGHIVILQGHLKTHDFFFSSTLWASKLKNNGQTCSFHDQTTQHV